jgi:NADH-quinone oxidoreductase subunit J
VTVNPVAFYVIATLVVATAIAVVTVPNIIHAAVALIGCFFMIAALYLAIGADFLAATQLLIYAGAIPVLIIFAVMLTRGSMRREGNGWVRWWPLALLVTMGLGAVLLGVVAVSRDRWHLGTYPQQLLDDGTTRTIGDALLNRYALPFEVASVLLLVALVGAVLLARRDESEAALERTEEDRRQREDRVRRRREERDRARRARLRDGVSSPGETP